MKNLEIGAIVILTAMLVSSGCMQHPPAGSGKAPPIRVRLIAGADQVLVSATEAPLVTSSGEGQPRRLDFPNSTGIPVTLSPSGWRIGSATFATGELKFEPQSLGSVRINGTPYRGGYRFVPAGPDRFDVINDVDIDSYLMSVVRSEMPANWSIEAYEAQAITARTYALYEAKTTGVGRTFDVHDDTKSQVYGGITNESAKSQQAVLDTAGVVVAYGPSGDEKIFKAYFSSCCGGVGQSANDAFGDPDIPPLREKNAGALCNASPRFNWGPIVFKKDELTRRIRSWGAKRNRPEKDMGTVVRIDIAAVNHYQRPVRFVITDSRGLQYSESGEELRWACNSDAKLGAPTLNSSFVKPITSPGSDEIQFVEGHGWGHAVGMCQWCAEVMAERGRRHEDIVRLSFPGAELVRAY